MKKVVFVLVVSILLTLPFAAFAEIDLSGMTYEELVALKDQINLAIWNSDTWEEVEVPQGVWKVGEDIPAGHWTVKCADGWRNTSINWGEELNEAGDSIDWNGRYSLYNSVYSETYKYYEVGDGATAYDFEVQDGDYIVIENGPAIFMPFSGKKSLGFKALK